MNLLIQNDGSVRCVYTDALPLDEIGALDIQRASNVEFNSATQQWEVRFVGSPDCVSFTAPSRAACIAWEIETINSKIAVQ